jgi:hypothetical protein
MKEHAMTKPIDGTWLSYAGTARIDLAIGLLVVAAGLGYAGARLRRPVRLPKASQTTALVLVLAWVLAVVAFAACAAQYATAMRQRHLLPGFLPHPITPVSAACVVVIAGVVLIITGSHGGGVRLASAAIAPLVALAIFEFPFDLLVVGRTYPALQPDPVLYRLLFFVPLFGIEFLTFSLLTFVPTVRVTRATCFCVALMLAIFAVWALSDGLAFPATPGPFAFNAVSKVVAFAAAMTLFIPARQHAPAAAPAAGAQICAAG